MKDAIQPPSVPVEVFVEVLGPDGLEHHVGPFKSREHAQAWIAQNSPDKSQTQAQTANAFTQFGNLKLTE